MTTQTFYRTVINTSGEQRRNVVRRATAAVLHALRDRLTVEEAEQVEAQLPRELKEMWEEGASYERRPLRFHRSELYERVKQEAELPTTREARWLALAVFAALKEQLSPGEVADVFAQLPKDLKELWAEAQAAS